MGFQQSTAMPNGITCSDAYFKVARIEMYDLARKRCLFKLEAWKDKAARDATEPAMDNIRGVTTALKFDVRGDDFDTYFGDDVLSADGVSILQKCYEYARAHADYTNATDVDPDE